MTATGTARGTLMAREAAEAPARVGVLLDANALAVARLAARLTDAPPRLVMTCARGSSDHAATYLQSLVHRYLGIPAMDLPPSVASIYGVDMALERVLFVVISQSGQSPDLVAGAEWAAAREAHVLALVNDADSPVASAAHTVLPLHAGPETSVAATKSYIAALVAGLQIVAALSGDAGLRDVPGGVPDILARAAALDWSPALPLFRDAGSAFTVGRGPGMGIAHEMALKFKETSVLHVEAFSSAEIMHGPLGVLQDNLPVLMIGQDDATLEGMRRLRALLDGKGVRVAAAMEGDGPGTCLPVLPGLHPAIAPIAAIQSFYGFAAELAVLRGHDPDRPAHLRKVTETR